MREILSLLQFKLFCALYFEVIKYFECDLFLLAFLFQSNSKENELSQYYGDYVTADPGNS